MTDTVEIRRALEVVIDPELHRSIAELDMVRSIDVSANGVVDVTVSLTTPGCPIKGHFQSSEWRPARRSFHGRVRAILRRVHTSPQLVRAIVGAGRYWRLGGVPLGTDPPAACRIRGSEPPSKGFRVRPAHRTCAY